MLVSYYVFHIVGMESGGLIDLVFMTNVVKLHMFAVNYNNAGKLGDPVAGKYLTERERYFAEILGEPISFYDWCQYFFFAASSWTGFITEFRDTNEYLNKKGGFANIKVEKLMGPAFKRFGHVFLMLI